MLCMISCCAWSHVYVISFTIIVSVCSTVCNVTYTISCVENVTWLALGNIMLSVVEGWIARKTTCIHTYMSTCPIQPSINGGSCHRSQGWAPATNMLTRNRLLKEPELTLQKAIDICRANEATVTQMKSLATNTHDEPADILMCVKRNNCVTNVETGIPDSKPVQLLIQNATNVDTTTILLRCEQWQIKMLLNDQKTKFNP